MTQSHAFEAVKPSDWQALSHHLDRALDLPTEARNSWLASLREDNATLATNLRQLLDQHEALRHDDFLAESITSRPDISAAGHRVGPYTLTVPIGRGGMGTVWQAKRSDGHFEGIVAIKLLNLGMIDRRGQVQFAREANILARLRHANIAHLIDAGVSEMNQPYLVLEHVDGKAIDVFCQDHGLDVRARVRLFLKVLDAVAHAHAHLIVHRDIKPSNVLVQADGHVKLLDFGIAKLLDGTADAWNTTGEGGRALTPGFAAPEQIAGGPITTATDVYGLGMLLYALLGGERREPTDVFHASRLESIDEEIPRLSTTSAEGHALRGDLDNIVAKALRRAPGERYPSVLALADDLGRYLTHEPVSARRDAVMYRTAKFLRRRRRPVAIAAALTVTMASMAAFYAARLESERDHARLEAAKSAKVTELLTSLLTGSDPYADDPREPTVRNILDAGAGRVATELRDQPDVQAEMLTVIGRVYQRLGVHAQAVPMLERAVAVRRSMGEAESAGLAQTLNDLGVLRREQGHLPEATVLLRDALAMRRRLLGTEHKDVAVTLVELGRALEDSGRTDEAEAVFREALAVRRRLFGEEHRETSTSKSALALVLRRRGDIAAAEPLFRESLATSRAVLPEEHPNVASGLNNLGLVLLDKGDFAGAEPLFRQSLAIKRKILGDAHITLAPTLNNLAGSLREQGRHDEARALLEQAVQLARDRLGSDHQSIAGYLVSLARIDLAQGRPADAEPRLRDALDRQRRSLRADDWRLAATQSLLGAARLQQGDYRGAEPLLVAASQVLRDVPGRQGRDAAATRGYLAALRAFPSSK